MANHSSILAWRIPRTEKPGGLESQGLKESDTTERLNSNNHTQQAGREGGLYPHPLPLVPVPASL